MLAEEQGQFAEQECRASGGQQQEEEEEEEEEEEDNPAAAASRTKETTETTAKVLVHASRIDLSFMRVKGARACAASNNSVREL